MAKNSLTIKLRHTHKHHLVKNGILSLAIKKKKTRELNVYYKFQFMAKHEYW